MQEGEEVQGLILALHYVGPGEEEDLTMETAKSSLRGKRGMKGV